jgi:DNA-binding IscR family transcriptional regulator
VSRATTRRSRAFDGSFLQNRDGCLTILIRTCIVLFMAANSLLASAVQILCVAAYVGGEKTNSEVIAKSLKTNPVVVRRILKLLEREGLVEVRPGRYGGVTLKRAPEDITLHDIHRAIEPEDGVFALRASGNPRCPVNLAMKGLLMPVFGAADAAVDDVLRQTRLASLVAQIG